MDAFNAALALRPLDNGRFQAEATADWGQGRAAFGGVVAGWGLRALAGSVSPTRALRTVQISFVAPVAPGVAEVLPRVIRAGRALTSAEVRVQQAGEDCALMLATYGEPRPSALRWPPAPMPETPPVEELPVLPFMEGITPTFTRHFEYRWAGSSFPFTGSDVAEVGGWVRLRDSSALDDASVLSLIDAWPAPILPLLHRPAPASTVSWMVDLLRPAPTGGWPADGWWRFWGGTVVASDGYADVTGRLWGPDGALVATSRQLVAEFSGRT